MDNTNLLICSDDNFCVGFAIIDDNICFDKNSVGVFSTKTNE